MAAPTIPQEVRDALAEELYEIAFMTVDQGAAAKLKEIARTWKAGETHPALRDTPCWHVAGRS